MKNGKKLPTSRLNRINKEIHANIIRVIGTNGESVGIMNTREALSKAKEIGVDLVEITPNAEPPVCRFMNYGKYLYEKNKSQKEQKKKQKIIQIKEIKFRPGTDEADYQVKIRSLIRFLESGDKIKVTLRFRGREITHQQIGINVLTRIKNDLSELALVESLPIKIEGRQMIMILSPKKKFPIQILISYNLINLITA
ncbi:Translation initiation factor IF-3 [Candidatus Providencia siddallii]|uniref:Translation initiation factor IF-3 n=1 Tax=Candidatus Providencia siddallii TaxID=1715285 RepID=A0A0M6W750_9GAMM|nr:Translation initiation factor IF-3 [Candidatus Providencia siddallii]